MAPVAAWRPVGGGSAVAVAALLGGAVIAQATPALTANPADAAQVASSTPIYLNTSYSFEQRAADLVSRKTLAVPFR